MHIKCLHLIYGNAKSHHRCLLSSIHATDIAFGYNQPWDPIPKLYSKYDALYPLIDDLGDDGVTLYASGPNRALRPITKAILESWEGW